MAKRGKGSRAIRKCIMASVPCAPTMSRRLSIYEREPGRCARVARPDRAFAAISCAVISARIALPGTAATTRCGMLLTRPAVGGMVLNDVGSSAIKSWTYGTST